MWAPILTGSRRDRAGDAVRAIADRLAGDPADAIHASDLVLFWAYVTGAFDEPAYVAAYEAALAALSTRFEQGFVRPGLHGGLAGAGWVLAHTSDEPDILAGVDAAILAAAARPPPIDYDLIQGLVGFAVYFRERQRPDAVGRVVDRLEALADAEGGWLTAAELLPPWHRERAPHGRHDLGVAHGSPGAIAALAAAGRTQSCTHALAWLRAHASVPDDLGTFTSVVGESTRRTAWCYGDLGIAAACWRASLDAGADPAEWRELARQCARRPEESCGVVDPNLCHGAAGIAHLCNRFYQASGEPVFHDAAVRWFDRVLAMRRSDGIAGFWARRPTDPNNRRALQITTAVEFLDGTIGVALALLAASSDVEPGWDRLLLSDLPVR